MKAGSTYDCFEIKSSSTFHTDFIKGVKSFDRAFPQLTGGKAVIYTGDGMPDYDGVRIMNYRDCLDS